MIGDLVLIHYQDRPTLYARVEAVEADVKRDWFQVTLLLLTIPAKTVTWILREEYIRGTAFTMGGQSMRLEKVCSQKSEPAENRNHAVPKPKKSTTDRKVIPIKRDS